jgi:hypothetical protein
LRGGQILGRHAGAHDIDAIEFGLGSDLIDLADPAEVSIVDVEREVLGHLLGISVPPLRIAFSIATTSSGSLLRLANVRFWVRPFSSR